MRKEFGEVLSLCMMSASGRPIGTAGWLIVRFTVLPAAGFKFAWRAENIGPGKTQTFIFKTNIAACEGIISRVDLRHGFFYLPVNCIEMPSDYRHLHPGGCIEVNAIAKGIAPEGLLYAGIKSLIYNAFLFEFNLVFGRGDIYIHR